MNLFEMAQIPLNKAIEVMKLDPNARIAGCRRRRQLLPARKELWKFPFP